MKWVRILDCDDPSLVAPIVLAFMVLSSTSSTSNACISNDILLIGILALEKCYVLFCKGVSIVLV